MTHRTPAAAADLRQYFLKEEENMARTIDDLRQMQALPLDLKISLTKSRIRQWVHEFGEDGVYISFSGGKDSTVLLHLVRSMYPNVPAVFVNTGLEYPEIVQFVKTFDNVDIIRPKMNFKQVIKKYGYPFISKEVTESVYDAKKYLTALAQSATIANRQTDRQTDDFRMRIVTENSVELANLLNERMKKRAGGSNQRLAALLGWRTRNKEHPISATIPNNDRSMFSLTKWKFLLFAPFDVSNICCDVMKKEPVHRYARETGRKPITAQMAQESLLRTRKWLQNGCNGFDMKRPVSNPLSFWTEQDILQYIRENGIKICSVYGDVVADEAKSENVFGQLQMDIEGNISEAQCMLKTTGCKRTGCMFCGFGCHLEKPGEGRFERMKLTHPKLYEWIMKPTEEGGLNYKAVIDWLNENGGLNIKY